MDIPPEIEKVLKRLSPLERAEFWAKARETLAKTPKFSVRKPSNGSDKETLFFMDL